MVSAVMQTLGVVWWTWHLRVCFVLMYLLLSLVSPSQLLKQINTKFKSFTLSRERNKIWQSVITKNWIVYWASNAWFRTCTNLTKSGICLGKDSLVIKTATDAWVTIAKFVKLIIRVKDCFVILIRFMTERQSWAETYYFQMIHC